LAIFYYLPSGGNPKDDGVPSLSPPLQGFIITLGTELNGEHK